MRRLWKRVPTKNELAEVLFKPMPQRQLLEEPSDSEKIRNMIIDEGKIVVAQQAWDMLGYTKD